MQHKFSILTIFLNQCATQIFQSTKNANDMKLFLLNLSNSQLFVYALQVCALSQEIFKKSRNLYVYRRQKGTQGPSWQTQICKTMHVNFFSEDISKILMFENFC